MLSQGGYYPMTKYDIRLFTDKGVRVHDKAVHDKGAKYDPAEISGMLVCVAMDYLKDASYQGTMKARVTTCGQRTEFMLLMKNNILDVYYHAGRFTRTEVQEPPEHHSGTASPSIERGAI